MGRLLLALFLLGFPGLCFAQEASSFPPLDGMMPRSEAEATIAGFDTRIAALETKRGVPLNDVTFAQNALVSVQLAGVKEFTVPTNCQVGDRILISPATVMPVGYMLGDAVCNVTGSMVGKMFTPQLGVGVSYSITVRVTAFR